MTEIRVEHVTCLGCGCACDDIAVTVRDGRIVDTSPACSVGRDWFDDGEVPWQVLRDGVPAPIEEAIAEAARLLAESQGRLLIYVGADLSSQAQRRAVSLADLLRANVDSATSDTAAAGVLAAQRTGRATATLGEIRNRADVLLFWASTPYGGTRDFTHVTHLTLPGCRYRTGVVIDSSLPYMWEPTRGQREPMRHSPSSRARRLQRFR